MIIQDYFNRGLEEIKKFKYYREAAVLLILVAALSLGSAFFYYRTRIIRLNAQRDFAECLDEYDNTLRMLQEGKENSRESWDDVENVFKSGYEKNVQSPLAPYFLVFEAEALIRQNKKKEAIELLKDFLSQMDKKSALYSLYEVKLNLIRLDINQEEAIQELDRLAEDESNPNRDLALFYLGEYYKRKDFEKTKRYWNVLVNLPGKGIGQSPWSDLVKGRLQE